jgi:hypothetical protein
MGCTEYGVHAVLQTLVEGIIFYTNTKTSLLKVNEAKIREYGELETVPLVHRVVI